MKTAMVRGRRRLDIGALLLGAAASIGCGDARTATPPASEESRVVDGVPSTNGQTGSPAAEDPRPSVVFLGDSLTAGFGLGEAEAFPALVGEQLAGAGTPIQVVNAGVSGDTTAGGARRIDWVLRQEPDLVVVALGGNDGLRGLPVEESEKNLRTIVERAQAAGARVVLAGMLLPPSYGPEYTEAFAAIYPRIAQDLDVALIPFLLEGVAADPALNLPDGIHPNAEGQRRVAEVVLPYVEAASQPP